MFPEFIGRVRYLKYTKKKTAISFMYDYELEP